MLMIVGLDSQVSDVVLQQFCSVKYSKAFDILGPERNTPSNAKVLNGTTAEDEGEVRAL